MAAGKPEVFVDFTGTLLPRAWFAALIARAANEPDKEKAALLAARAVVEDGARGQPEDASTLSPLGRIDAGLGNQEKAWQEGRRAVELLPVSVDAVSGPAGEISLALIYAWTGETEQALRLLGPLGTMPGGPH